MGPGSPRNLKGLKSQISFIDRVLGLGFHITSWVSRLTQTLRVFDFRSRFSLIDRVSNFWSHVNARVFGPALQVWWIYPMQSLSVTSRVKVGITLTYLKCKFATQTTSAHLASVVYSLYFPDGSNSLNYIR